MSFLLTLLILIADIPQELYSSYCNREVIDSVYTDCRQTAIQDYPDNADAGTDYLMADWAYGVSLLDLSEYCISNALDADVYDKILLADCLSMASAIARLRGNLATAIKAYDECVKVCTDTRNIYIESRARKDLWQLHKAVAPEKALLHLERYVDLQGTLNSEETAELMQSFNVKYETLEKEQTIALQKNRIIYISIALALFIAFAAVSAVLAVMKNKAARALEEKNAVLVKANLDKEKLLTIAKSNIPKEVTSEILSIASSTDAMPEVKLTKREMQIAESLRRITHSKKAVGIDCLFAM